MSQIPVILIFLPVLTALFIYLFKWRHMHLLALLTQTGMTILAIVYFLHFKDQFEATHIILGGWSDVRIGISLANDGLSMAFIFLTLFMWWSVLTYLYRFGKTEHTFLFFLMFLQGVFLGLLQSNDLFNLFVFFELTTIIVTILIAYKKTGESFRAAIYYLLLNTSGVLLFLIAIVMLYNLYGTINIRVLSEVIHTHADTTILKFAYVLMMTGISVKAALFPVFTWLPKAHGVAQSAISALLSGLIVKGGIYLFFRINFLFESAGLPYHNIFFILGLLTALSGIIFALAQKNIKLMLAYSTVSQIGLIIMGLSSPDITTFYGGVLHTFNHALFKALLFLGAGVIIAVYRTKKLDEIRGVFRTMPIISVMMIIGMLAITGMPFFNGYISKSIIKYGFEDSVFRTLALYLVNIGTTTLFIKMSHIFFGPKMLSYPMKHRQQNITLLLLALACLVFGNFYVEIMDAFFGIDYAHITRISLGGLLDYGITVIIGILIYLYVLKKDVRLVKGIREFKISFETANILFIALLTVLTFYFVIL